MATGFEWTLVGKKSQTAPVSDSKGSGKLSSEDYDLIGAPIIISDDGYSGVSELESSRRGLIRLTPAMKQEISTKNKSAPVEFSLGSTAEWPAFQSSTSTGAVNNTGSDGKSWSSALKAPPPVKVEQKVEKASNEREEVSSGDEKETATKKKKKKAKEGLIKDKQPLQLELGSLFDNLVVKKGKKVVLATGSAPMVTKATPTPVQRTNPDGDKTRVANILDATAPLVRKGKDREEPKKRKPTPLRKIIDKEKQERKLATMNEKPGPVIEAVPGPITEAIPGPLLEAEPESIVEVEPGTIKEAPGESSMYTPSPTEEQLGQKLKGEVPDELGSNSGGKLEHDSNEYLKKVETGIKPHPPPASKPTKPGHNRRFREYCDHVITNEINECAAMLLSELVRFQDRHFLKDPLKAKVRKRYVCGMREVLKHLKSKRVKCLIVAPNMERIKSEGGIDDIVDQILSLAQEQGLPIIFAMSRRRMAYVLKKPHNVACVGIFRHEGAEAHYKQLLELVEEAREQYRVKILPQIQAADETSNKVPDQDPGDKPEEKPRENPWSVFFPHGQMPSVLAKGDHVIKPPSHGTSTQFNIFAKEFVPLNVNAPEFKPKNQQPV